MGVDPTSPRHIFSTKVPSTSHHDTTLKNVTCKGHTRKRCGWRFVLARVASEKHLSTFRVNQKQCAVIFLFDEEAMNGENRLLQNWDHARTPVLFLSPLHTVSLLAFHRQVSPSSLYLFLERGKPSLSRFLLHKEPFFSFVRQPILSTLCRS